MKHSELTVPLNAGRFFHARLKDTGDGQTSALFWTDFGDGQGSRPLRVPVDELPAVLKTLRELVKGAR